MTNGKVSRRQLDQLYDFAELTRKILELYENIRVTMTRDMLLAELHQKLRGLNGAADHRRFQPYILVLRRIFAELPAHPEHTEAGITCAEQLIAAIEQMVFVQAHQTEEGTDFAA